MSDEIHRALGRIEGKLDGILEVQEKHSVKIDGLEKLKVQALTLVGVLSVGISVAWDALKTRFMQ